MYCRIKCLRGVCNYVLIATFVVSALLASLYCSIMTNIDQKGSFLAVRGWGRGSRGMGEGQSGDGGGAVRGWGRGRRGCSPCRDTANTICMHAAI